MFCGDSRFKLWQVCDGFRVTGRGSINPDSGFQVSKVPESNCVAEFGDVIANMGVFVLWD